MFIRRKPNKSGTFSIQVVSKRDGRYILEKSFGASSDETTLKDLEMQASDWMAHYEGQRVIDFAEHEILENSRLTAEGVLDNIDRVLLNGPLHILNNIYDTIGFNLTDKEVNIGIILKIFGIPTNCSYFCGRNEK